MTTNQPSTYHVVIAPANPADPEFTEQFGLHKVTVQATNERDAIMRAAIRSGVAEYECGDFTVRSVVVVHLAPAIPVLDTTVTFCGYVDGTVPTMVDCARAGCHLCQGELDIACDDSWMEAN